MSLHIRDTLLPLLQLMEELNLLEYGEKDMIKNRIKYKGQLFKGKAYGKGTLVDLRWSTTSVGTFYNVTKHGVYIETGTGGVLVNEFYLGRYFGK